MITLRKADERGKVNIQWLESRHSFSFGDYYDPRHMGFGSLRVINEDSIQPAAGFGTHPHKDMEIITFVTEGALEHKDSLGTGSIIRSGDVQRMTAGTGITHSEFNHHADQKVHLLQIWVLPEKNGLPPSYQQKNFAYARKKGGLTLLASRDGREGSITVHQDMEILVLDMARDQPFSYEVKPQRKIWLQVVKGNAVVNSVAFAKGDGAALVNENRLEFSTGDNAEILVFDMQ